MIDDPDDFDEPTDTEAEVECPYCGEPTEITLDPSGGLVQHYVDDCPVCCQPWMVSVAWDEDGHADVTLMTLDE